MLIFGEGLTWFIGDTRQNCSGEWNPNVAQALPTSPHVNSQYLIPGPMICNHPTHHLTMANQSTTNQQFLMNNPASIHHPKSDVWCLGLVCGGSLRSTYHQPFFMVKSYIFLHIHKTMGISHPSICGQPQPWVNHRFSYHPITIWYGTKESFSDTPKLAYLLVHDGSAS